MHPQLALTKNIFVRRVRKIHNCHHTTTKAKTLQVIAWVD